jgi:hypothetical protein
MVKGRNPFLTKEGTSGAHGRWVVSYLQLYNLGFRTRAIVWSLDGGMIYPYKFYEACLRECGFASIEKIRFGYWSPHGLIVAKK